MNKYNFVYDKNKNEHRLMLNPINMTFSPRAFAQNFFEKLEDKNKTDDATKNAEPMLKFVQGDDENVVYKEDNSYPIVTDITPSARTANLLKNLMFSQDGIMTSGLSFAYQSWNTALQDANSGKYFKTLAQNDFAVFDALGNMTAAFGGDANFVTSNNRNWSTQFLILTNDKTRFLKNMIASQQRLLEQINFAIDNVENQSLKRFLNAIKSDRMKIIDDLTNLL